MTRGHSSSVSVAPVGLGHGCCGDSDGRPVLRTDVPFSHIHTPQYVATRNSGRSGKSGAAGHFYDTLLELDETVGSIMAALAENKLDENTLVLVTGDNGPCECSNGRRGLSLLLRL